MSETKQVIILGVGGNCIDILDTLREINTKSQRKFYECIGFLDDNKSTWNKIYHGVKVLGSLEKARKFNSAYFINGIGNPKNFWEKEEIIAHTKVPLERFLSLSHPTASVSKMAKIGIGTMIFQNVTIASNAVIGNHVMILPNTIISHNVKIGEYSIVTGGVCISGGVSIGKSCYLGTNSSIIGNSTVGDCSLIGMGSVVLGDVPANSVFIGNPAKFLRTTTQSKLKKI